jgi:hypothetical protein
MSILDVTVTIAGVDYTGDTLGNVKIVRGRQDIETEPRAGYTICELVDQTGAGFPFAVTDTITVDIDTSTGPRRMFTGTISDITTRLYAVRTGTRAIWNVLASGPLALTNRRQVLEAGTPAAEKDGTLVAQILEAGLTQTWQEYRGTTWAAAGDVTWETVDPGYDPSLVEQPGEYDIQALDPAADGYNAYGLAAQIAVSTGGQLFETGTGGVGYLSAYGRSALAAAGYTAIPVQQILTDGLGGNISAQTLVNRIEVAYDGGTVEVSDADSISRFGLRTSFLRTLLAAQADAEDRADDMLFDLATPRFRLPQISFALHTLSDAEIDLLLQVDTQTPVSLNGLPTTLGTLPTRGFVEGLQISTNGERRNVTYYISDAQLSLRSERWRDVTSTIAWEDVSATLEWADARRITV